MYQAPFCQSIAHIFVIWELIDPFLKLQILDSSELKKFTDDNFFKFYENGGELSKGLENSLEKGEIARYEQFRLFPHCFQKFCTADL